MKKVNFIPVRPSTAMHLKNMAYSICFPWDYYTYFMSYFKYRNVFWKAFFFFSPCRLTLNSKIRIVFIHQHSMKKALKKLWANAQLLTIGFTLHSKEQLLDFSYPVQRKKKNNTPNFKLSRAPEYLFPIGRTLDQNKVNSNSIFLHYTVWHTEY